MRHSILLLSLSSLVVAGCASATGIAHPTGSAAEERPVPPPPVEGEDFVVFTGEGEAVDLDAVIAEAGSAEVVFFGEEHNDLTTHRVQTEVLRRLFARYGAAGGPSPHPGADGVSTPAGGGDRTVVLSLEMFERDVQTVLDEYLADLITEDHLEASARPWDRYDTDYRPAVEFAKAHELPVVAANAPRRYVNRVSRLGRESLDALSDDAIAHLPPLPYPAASGAYQAEWDELMGDAAEYMPAAAFEAQLLWDAAMAYSVARALDRVERGLVLHLAGSFHVANHTGTPEALEHYRPGTRALVLVARPADDRSALPEEFHGEGDFVILTRGEISGGS